MRHETILTKIYEAFLERTSLPAKSADELLLEVIDNAGEEASADDFSRIAFLEKFCRVWTLAEDQARAEYRGQS